MGIKFLRNRCEIFNPSFWESVEALHQGMYTGHGAADCVLHARDHVKFPMFHVDIDTGEATAVDGVHYSELGQIRIAEVGVSTKPQQMDGPQQLAYKIEAKKL